MQKIILNLMNTQFLLYQPLIQLIGNLSLYLKLTPNFHTFNKAKVLAV